MADGKFVVEGDLFERVCPVLVTRWVHHNPTTTLWQLTAFPSGSCRSVTSKNRLTTAHGALWR